MGTRIPRSTLSHEGRGKQELLPLERRGKQKFLPLEVRGKNKPLSLDGRGVGERVITEKSPFATVG